MVLSVNSSFPIVVFVLRKIYIFLFNVVSCLLVLAGNVEKNPGPSYTKLNNLLETECGKPFILHYEPMLISSAVSGNIYGAKAENQFRSCLRDLENGTITYHTNDCKEPITLHCFKEKQPSLTASVEVLNVITILLNEVQMVRGRVPKFEELQKQESDADSYCVTHTV